MSKQLGREVAIRGNADQGGFDLPCMVRGIENFLMDLLDHPDDPRLAQLMEVCYQSHLGGASRFDQGWGAPYLNG
jgi:hypothetical protein